MRMRVPTIFRIVTAMPPTAVESAGGTNLGEITQPPAEL
jgi:hypothetical protein